MRWSVVTVAAAVFMLGGVSGCATARGRVPEAIRDASAVGTGTGAARNVILLIGDGLGDSEITVARNYHVGAAGRLALDRLPVTGALTTYTVQEADPTRPDYVGDSAATATAWATGHKTSNHRLSTAAGSGAALRTILELAQAGGLATGSVSTAELTDATPAALAAHVNHRSCQGPADMKACPAFRTAAGGLGSIAEQTVNHHIDVLLGGGRQRFAQTIDGGRFAGQTVVQSAVAQGYTVVSDATELDALVSQGATATRRVLGLFTPGDMTVEWAGQPAAPFPGSGPQRCTEGRRPPPEPDLASMARAALALLDRPARPGASSPGFFLQIEGASIDKRNHAADPCGQIGETVAFDAAVAVALDYAAHHPDTLVIVTGDHAHTSQIIPAPEPADHSPGVFSTLLTADGAPMTVAYATNVPGRSQEHTGTQIRVAAQGPGAAMLNGVHDQTDLFRIMATALGLAPAASEVPRWGQEIMTPGVAPTRRTNRGVRISPCALGTTTCTSTGLRRFRQVSIDGVHVRQDDSGRRVQARVPAYSRRSGGKSPRSRDHQTREAGGEARAGPAGAGARGGNPRQAAWQEQTARG